MIWLSTVKSLSRGMKPIATDLTLIHVLGSIHFDVFTLKNSDKLIQFDIRDLRNVI